MKGHLLFRCRVDVEDSGKACLVFKEFYKIFTFNGHRSVSIRNYEIVCFFECYFINVTFKTLWDLSSAFKMVFSRTSVIFVEKRANISGLISVLFKPSSSYQCSIAGFNGNGLYMSCALFSMVYQFMVCLAELLQGWKVVIIEFSATFSQLECRYDEKWIFTLG